VLNEIFVTTFIDGIHRWPGATGDRAYLAYPHRHRFDVTVYAKVTHDDRDIEFHDLKDAVDITLITIGEPLNRNTTLCLDFGTMSCEEIAKRVLQEIPAAYKVRVSEDGQYGAEARGSVRKPVHMRSPVVTICGSTKFREAYEQAIKWLEEEGCITLSVGSYMHADSVPIASEQKEAFDRLHKEKIDMSDWIYVVNVGGYIGESTRSEIEHAKRRGIPVKYLEEPTE